MTQVELIMPKMGESIMEATILKWLKNIGDAVEADEPILEIATDKVDSEVPSPVDGVIAKILFQENDIVEVGKVIALIATEEEDIINESSSVEELSVPNGQGNGIDPIMEPIPAGEISQSEGLTQSRTLTKEQAGRFYSPLVRNIALQENISSAELDAIPGTGMKGRVTKKDILSYLRSRKTTPVAVKPTPSSLPKPTFTYSTSPSPQARTTSGATEIIEMDRMRKMIAKHMVMSKQTSPHVTSFVEVDVTNIVNWRNGIKESFFKHHGEKITFTPIFIEAVVKAIQDFPMINISVDGDKIIVKGNINVGMATALPSGNLIVPVIKNTDQLNLLGLTKVVNDLAARARENKLKPEEIQEGTFTLTNVGTFGNVMGTPIINQPQVAILAIGAIRKKPAVVETEYGDLIAVRQLMFLSLSYDHRVVDGFLGGSFLQRVADYLEAFDTKRTF